MTDLSIVIVSYNTRRLLGDCLGSLPEAAQGLRWEAVVVDNASSDGSAEFVESRFPAVRLIRNGENVGFSRACNQGVKASCGASLLFLNSDAQPRPQSLARLAGFLRDHPRCGAVGPRLVPPSGVAACCSFFRFPSLTRPFMDFAAVRAVFSERFTLAYPPQNTIAVHGGRVDWISGACLLARRSTLEAVGRWDERYFMYYEDVDLCRRLNAAGWEIVYWPFADVVHLSGESAKREPLRLSVEIQRSRLTYFSIHHPGTVYALQRLMVAAAALLRGLWSLGLLEFVRLRAETQIIRLALRHGNGGWMGARRPETMGSPMQGRDTR